MENWKAVREETPSQIELSSKQRRESMKKEVVEVETNSNLDPIPNDQPAENENGEEAETEVDQFPLEPRNSGDRDDAIRRVSLKDDGDKNGDVVDQPPPFPPQKRRSSIITRPTAATASETEHEDAQVDPRYRRLSIVETAEDDFQDLNLKNAKEAAYTLLDRECAADDVIRVWECISKFITFKLLEGKGVRIAGLGTFTFRIRKMPVNQKTVKVTKSPVFILSEYVTQMYRLKQDKIMTSNVPEVPLNLSVISNDTRISRSLIEGILTEVLQAFARGIVCNKFLEFPFPYIGKLQIRDQKVSMKFYDEFVKKLGFHVVETTPDENVLEGLIPGRMTPLRFHIPSDNFRSVFHLRDLRSVHEFPLLVPLVQIDGKLFPETLVEGIGSERENRKRKTKALISIVHLKMNSLETDDIPTMANSLETDEIPTMAKKTPKVVTKPLYEPKKTGDCILDLMNSCPEVMTRCLRAHMYKEMIATLGAGVVKSRFHRRGNNCPVREFSYENVQLNQNYASETDVKIMSDKNVHKQIPCCNVMNNAN